MASDPTSAAATDDRPARPAPGADASLLARGSPSRSIAFYPSRPDRAKTLSPAQVDAFNRNGFVRPLKGLDAQETAAARGYFETLLARVRALKDGRNAYTLDGYHNRCRGIWEIAQHPVILDYVEDLLGPDFVCWSSHYFCKLPGDVKRIPWHQDATYWPVRPTKTVTAWLAIDDVGEDNAPMRFLPGSHRHGAIRWEPAAGPAVLYQEVKDIDRFGAPVANTLRAGELSIHASTLLHGSEPNCSRRRRCGLALRYIPSDCGAIESEAALERRGLKAGTLRRAVLANAVVCRGAPGRLATQRRTGRRRCHDDPPALSGLGATRRDQT